MSTSLSVLLLPATATHTWTEPTWELAGERGPWRVMVRNDIVAFERLRAAASTWSKATHVPIGFGSVETSDYAYLCALRNGNIEGYALINPELAAGLADGMRVLHAFGWSREDGAVGVAGLAAWGRSNGAAPDLRAMERIVSATWVDALEGLDAVMMATDLPVPATRPSHALFGEATSMQDAGGTTIRGVGVRFEAQPYLMGEGAGFLGVWDRSHPEAPIARFPITPDGILAREAFFITQCFAVQSPEFGDAWKVPDAGPFPTGLEGSEHTQLEQERFLLGWGKDFLGIWDRLHAEAPLHRFPETVEGRRRAWDEWLRLRRSG